MSITEIEPTIDNVRFNDNGDQRGKHRFLIDNIDTMMRACVAQSYGRDG